MASYNNRITYFSKATSEEALLANVNHTRAGYLSDVNVHMVRMITFLVSSISAVIAEVLVRGFGDITTAVVGGATLMSGKGSVLIAMFGAMTLGAMVNLINLLALPKPFQVAHHNFFISCPIAFVAFKESQKIIMKKNIICAIIFQIVNLKKVYQGGGVY
jgi:ribose/xylose/arabinose/galactoside ABC-type transport system permease subunit